jgi:hypothetical protein
VALSVGLNPLPLAVSHDPLGRAMTEDQKIRLREQLAPPIEEASAKERVKDRRREDNSGATPGSSDDERNAPGSIIDSYA